ncbi:MAG TPA: FtsQ-type POTRA domain-containing protein [Alphaproteobacteria bacterium]|nr:FtsQ-type POTRA domain-containing protein [Micavibrio sp.]MBK9561784.1 FtsQ-type POTRA domain-containing protein [Micavibrio sp.]HQX26653.1 FtsQ-type POTRA domain-containing protein [Alphaproteobacteria bacterium]
MATYKSKFTGNKRRKGPLSVLMPWLKRFGIALAIAGLSFWAGSWFFLSGSATRTGDWLAAQVHEGTSEAGFSVQNIMVEGRVYTNPEILKAIIATEKGDPLFAFDPVAAQEQIKRINWIRDAHVERRLPDTIYVGLTEKKPLALWQEGGTLELLDEKGKPITRENLGRFKNLVIVMGEGAPERAPELVKNLEAEPQIMSRVKAAKWIGGRRWDLVFRDDITAKLPEGETGLALRKLAEAVEKEGLLEKDILSVDLREESRMIVEPAPGAAQDYQASTKAGSNI